MLYQWWNIDFAVRINLSVVVIPQPIIRRFDRIFVENFWYPNDAARGGLFGAGGRFKGGTDPIMEKFNESLSFDKR